MSQPTVTQIRQRIAAAIATIEGWTESRHPADRLGKDTKSQAHQAFAVSLPDTTTKDPGHKTAHGVYCKTQVQVRWSYQLRDDAVVSDTDAALTAETALVAAIFTQTDGTGISSLTVDTRRRASTPEGTHLVGEIRLTVAHFLALVP